MLFRSDEEYWGRPVPSFGDARAAVVVVGLAPAAHGGNRTGRMFTGDRSGDFLVAALYRTGFANQPESVRVGDGLELTGLRMVAPVHCAPPANAPTPAERHRCAPFLGRELELLAPTLRAAVVLGGFGWRALLATLADQGWAVPRPRPVFGHGAEVTLAHPDGRQLTVLGSFHVSPHNTFTGRLTPAMLDAVLERARQVAGGTGNQDAPPLVDTTVGPDPMTIGDIAPAPDTPGSRQQLEDTAWRSQDLSGH